MGQRRQKLYGRNVTSLFVARLEEARLKIVDIVSVCAGLAVRQGTLVRPVTRVVRGVRPNPPFREPPSTYTNPPPLKLSNSISGI